MQERNRIPTIVMQILVSLAGFIDLIQALAEFIPVIGNIFARIISICAWISFTFYFILKDGLEALKGKAIAKRLITRTGSIVGETVLAGFPLLTAYVLVECLMIRQEDKEYNKEMAERMDPRRGKRRFKKILGRGARGKLAPSLGK